MTINAVRMNEKSVYLDYTHLYACDGSYCSRDARGIYEIQSFNHAIPRQEQTSLNRVISLQELTSQQKITKNLSDLGFICPLLVNTCSFKLLNGWELLFEDQTSHDSITFTLKTAGTANPIPVIPVVSPDERKFSFLGSDGSPIELIGILNPSYYSILQTSASDVFCSTSSAPDSLYFFKRNDHHYYVYIDGRYNAVILTLNSQLVNAQLPSNGLSKLFKNLKGYIFEEGIGIGTILIIDAILIIGAILFFRSRNKVKGKPVQNKGEKKGTEIPLKKSKSKTDKGKGLSN